MKFDVQYITSGHIDKDVALDFANFQDALDYFSHQLEKGFAYGSECVRFKPADRRTIHQVWYRLQRDWEIVEQQDS